MFFSASLNPKKSILISFLSGVGLLAVVGIAPTREEIQTEKKEIILESKSDENSRNGSFKRAIQEQSEHKKEKTPSLLNLRIKSEDLLEYQKDYQIRREKLGPLSQTYGKILSIKNYTPERLILNRNDSILSRSLQWKEGNSTVQASHTFQPNTFSSQIWVANNPFRSRRIHTNNLEYLDIDIPISKSVSAVFTSSSGDVFDDRRREGRMGNFALAGISLNKGDVISTRFVAGDPNLQLHSQQRSPGYFGATNVQTFKEMGFSEREASQLRSFEWQTNIKPTKSVRIQTALYNNPSMNVNQSRQQNSSMPDSGRMSMFFGEKRMIMNVKYDYQMSQQNLRQIMTQWQPQQDSASVGFIFFLDPSQKYSVYLGGNQFNIADRFQNNTNRDAPGQMPASFTASFRGKTSGREQSSFFVNFQNQPPGVWGVGMPNQMMQQDQANQGSKSFYEYATTLGLEVNF
ncbi:MAG: hypothetical protein JJT78_11260 [Leptospira sp.]|nr:hypothetical protein [Leptospira sp.]